MITKEQARVIYDLVKDIEDDSAFYTGQSCEGTYFGLEQAKLDLSNSKIKFEQFIESLIE